MHLIELPHYFLAVASPLRLFLFPNYFEMLFLLNTIKKYFEAENRS